MTVTEVPSGTQLAGTWLGGRFRLDERISISEHIHGTCGASWEAHGLSLWKATDRLLACRSPSTCCPGNGPWRP